MSYGYGSSIARALKRHNVSVTAAAEVMGYRRTDMLYKILRDEADPSLDKLQKLADHINEPIGDLLPNSGANPVSDELRDVLAVMSGISGKVREEIIAALTVNARVLVNMTHKLAGEHQTATDSPTQAMAKTEAIGVGFRPEQIDRLKKAFEGTEIVLRDEIIDKIFRAIDRTSILLTDNTNLLGQAR